MTGIINGDCISLMADLESSSIDAIVTDPPYGLEFMGKEWDKFGGRPDPLEQYDGDGGMTRYFKGNKPVYEAGYSFQAWVTQWAVEALRILKPGGSLLSFGGTRTFHRLTCGLEDAGFVIKDCLMWLYGQGFPKAQDLGKMIDKRAGAEREVVGTRTMPDHRGDNYGQGKRDYTAIEIEDTLPATPLAVEWDGWKIGGIKPAWEPIIWAVKPPEKSYLDNVLKYGVGAVNVDECRLAPSTDVRPISGGTAFCGDGAWGDVDRDNANPKGRFPANLVLDEEAARMLDEQSGVSSASGQTRMRHNVGFHDDNPIYGHGDGSYVCPEYGDTGGVSRFFYTSKATDRDSFNDHPTLKPTDLIEWLIRLVTRPGQLVLDPFAGSGTTGVAAIKTGREYLLMEQDEHYCEIAEKRTIEGVQRGMF